MRKYYIKTSTYGTNMPSIIEEEVMYQAERGMNYLNPDDYMFHCEADCLHDAKKQYWEEFSRMAFDHEAEKDHP